MKNIVIAIMTVLCGYLLLHALGAFEFGSFIDREHREHHVALRTEAVHAAPEYVLGAVYDDRDWADVETVKGIAVAVDIVNSQKSGKPFKLITRSEAHSKPLHNTATQTFADARDTAALVGPFESVHIPATRALTQFYGLPLISPVTVASDKLPSLEPDNFVTLFPPLPLWVKAMLQHMQGRGFKKLFILSPSFGTYGDIFCTEMERIGRSHHGFTLIFRLNYQEPLRRHDIERLLRSRAGEVRFDAIFFGGSFQDLAEFSSILKDNEITLPVYGSDSLCSPEVTQSPGDFDLYLPKALWKNENTAFTELWRQRQNSEPGYLARFGADTVFLLHKVLQNIETYDPQSVVEAMRKAVDEYLGNPESAPKIVMTVFPKNSGQAPAQP
ncbi:ABC transporter substrate-binding protein [Desulfovibrio sp. OttesenSCG-928-G15]|nr:ABC transporter substrate-binding protein [Desulfovibrio sp. OttesenSCG-928-G15]